MSSELKNKFVAKSLPDLYLKSEFADVHFTFEINGETIKVPANKAILAIASPVFQAMFFGPMKEGDIVQIIDTNDSAFKEFLQFFYLPNVKLTMKNIEAVVQLVDKYDMVDCLNACVEFLENELTMEKMIWGLQLAISMNNQKLKEFCQNKIQSLTSDCLKSDIFLHCDQDVVKNILQLEVFCCSEVELFEACIAWAKMSCEANGLDENDSENLRNQLGDCFYLIRFGAMEYKEICSIVSNKQYTGLFTKDEMVNIFCSKSDEDFQPPVFKNTPRSPSFKWDSSNELMCSHGVFSLSKNFVVRSRESTWFSTNAPVLLGKIYSLTIFCDYVRELTLNFTVNIIEYEEHTFGTSGAAKVLYTDTMQCTTGSDDEWFSLARPIPIRPNKLYEFRLDSTQTSTDVYHQYSWMSEVKLTETIVVKFHKNPSDKYQSGLVDTMLFHPIAK